MEDKQFDKRNKVLERFKFFTFLLISLLFLYLGIFLFIYGSAIVALIYIILWVLNLFFIGKFYSKRGVINAFILYIISSQFIIGGILIGFDPSRYFFGYLVRTDYNIIYIIGYTDYPGGLRKKYPVINNKITVSEDSYKNRSSEYIYLHNTRTNKREQLSLQQAQKYSIINVNSLSDRSPDGVYIKSIPFGFPESENLYYLTNSWGNQKQLNGQFERPEQFTLIGWVKQ
ncbi:MAG: hypothetical protein WD512_12435 [Candidatus Paceibacterota bacterium]